MKPSLLLQLPFSKTEERLQRPSVYRPSTPARTLTTSRSSYRALKIVQPFLGLVARHPSPPRLPRPRVTASLSSLKRDRQSYAEKTSSPTFLSKVPYQTIAEFLMKRPMSKELTWVGPTTPATQSNVSPSTSAVSRRPANYYRLKRVQIRLPTFTREPEFTRQN
jgi:hypothetical protein